MPAIGAVPSTCGKLYSSSRAATWPGPPAHQISTGVVHRHNVGPQRQHASRITVTPDRWSSSTAGPLELVFHLAANSTAKLRAMWCAMTDRILLKIVRLQSPPGPPREPCCGLTFRTERRTSRTPTAEERLSSSQPVPVLTTALQADRAAFFNGALVTSATGIGTCASATVIQEHR